MKIILAEDDRFFQKFYSTKLREAGYEVDVASDGSEALVRLAKNNYDLILLDLIMPNTDGFEVLHKKSSIEKIKKIPVIVFSTLGQKQDVDKALQLGANDYMNKTFYNFDALLKKIQKIQVDQA